MTCNVSIQFLVLLKSLCGACENHKVHRYRSGLMPQVSCRILGGLLKNKSFFWVRLSHLIFFFFSLLKLSACFTMEKIILYMVKSHNNTTIYID